MNGMRRQQGPMGRMGRGQWQGSGDCNCGCHGHGPGYGSGSGRGHECCNGEENTEKTEVQERGAGDWRDTRDCGCHGHGHGHGHGHERSDRQNGESDRTQSRENLEAYRRDLEEELADVSSRISKMG
ncbi:MAG: DUF5320 family protein [Acidimicrobiales bacterium]